MAIVKVNESVYECMTAILFANTEEDLEYILKQLKTVDDLDLLCDAVNELGMEFYLKSTNEIVKAYVKESYNHIGFIPFGRETPIIINVSDIHKHMYLKLFTKGEN